MRAAPCGGAATRRRTFISWAAWLCVSPSLSFSVSLPFFLLSWPLFHPLYFSPSSFFPLPSVSESKKLCVLSRVGQWMYEVRWKLIVERSEMSCEGIHGTDCTDSSISFRWLPPSLFYSALLSLCFNSRRRSPSLDLVAFVAPLSTLPSLLTWNIHFRPMKYREGPHELFTV